MTTNILHITQLDEPVLLFLESQAKEQHVSVEEIVRRFLRAARTSKERIAPALETPPDKNQILKSISGMWSEADALEFERNIAPMEDIDHSLWQ